MVSDGADVTPGSCDTAVIGGGFYGCMLALFLRETGREVVIFEKGPDLLTRASYVNQARVHQGYHYPRNFMTALRSGMNFPRFVVDFRECIDDSFQKIYAIARGPSKTTSTQFQKFCQNIGAPIRPAPARIKRLFNEALIEDAFTVREVAFDASALRAMLQRRLTAARVSIFCNTAVESVQPGPDHHVILRLQDGHSVVGRQVFNCSYSQVNTFLHRLGAPLLPLKHEITEIALVDPPEELLGLGVTVMDGPFFSIMPFPARGFYSFTHVRYTPHEAWQDASDFRDADQYFRSRRLQSNFPLMIRDAQRYLPAIRRTRYVESLYEVKTLVVGHEIDDGRPIMLRLDHGLKNFSTVMGGKIDNIYDVLQALRGLREKAEPAVSVPLPS